MDSVLRKSLEQIRVMSFNIRFDNPKDGEYVWKNRKRNVASMIRFHRADVIGVQEALKNQIADLTVELDGEYSWVGKGRDDGNEGGEYVPIFYKSIRFQYLNSGHFWLSETPEKPGSRSWNAACARMCSWVRLMDRINGKHFYFFNTHLDHQSRDARTKGVTLIRSKIQEINDERIPLIFTGDLNCSAEEETVSIIVDPSTPHCLQDAKKKSKTALHGPIGTFTGFENARSTDVIDYIFVSKECDITHSGVLSDTFENSAPPSDHRPIVADIDLV